MLIHIQSNFALRQNLALSFGTKKSRKAIESLTQNAITSAPNEASTPNADGSPSKPKPTATPSALLAALPTSTPSAQLATAITENKPIPTPNLAATTPQEVYTPESLIGADIFPAINFREWRESVKNNEAITTTSRFVSSRVAKLAKIGDADLLRALRYLFLLLNFNNALKPASNGSGLSKRLPSPQDLRTACAPGPGLASPVLESVKRRFCTGVGLSRQQVDLLQSHILALALVIDNCETDMHDLRDDLRTDNLRMVTLAKELGARVGAVTEKERTRMGWTKAEAGDRKVARLRLPLEFPTVRRGRRGR